MNPIQKAWLKLLSPVSGFVNEKLAKRSGILGRLGRFFLIGPREYGVHPINKMFIYINRRILFVQGAMLHRYSAVKAISQNGYNMLRPYKHLAFVPPLFTLFSLFIITYHGPSNRHYEPDSLTYVHKRLGGHLALPLSTMNQRTSGHYLEINHIYTGEMLKKYHNMHKRIVEQRNKVSEKTKRTKYADPSYKYVPMKKEVIPDDE